MDPGAARVGVALSDETETLATPLEIVRGGPGTARAIASLARERDAELVVVGLPLRMDGSEGPEAEGARSLAAEIGAASGLPVRLWDERLTTVQAQRQRQGKGLPRGRRRPVDSEAAAVLLQSYLDRGEARR